MALLFMRVSGRRRDELFFPQAAGVGLSYNPWCWHPDIDPEVGITRLVFGLGTRAVDRADDENIRLVSLSVPASPTRGLEGGGTRPLATPHGCHRSRQARTRLPAGRRGPADLRGFSRELLHRPRARRHAVGHLHRLIKQTPVIDDLREMLAVLARVYGAPVDIEFALNFLDEETYRIHLLQCRTF